MQYTQYIMLSIIVQSVIMLSDFMLNVTINAKGHVIIPTSQILQIIIFSSTGNIRKENGDVSSHKWLCCH